PPTGSRRSRSTPAAAGPYPQVGVDTWPPWRRSFSHAAVHGSDSSATFPPTFRLDRVSPRLRRWRSRLRWLCAGRLVSSSSLSRRRLRHAVTENARVRAAVEILEGHRPDWQALGALFLAAHESLRRDFEVSTPELDVLVELAYEAGAFAARMTGAGFGGSIVV